jgi:hypothetical protein
MCAYGRRTAASAAWGAAAAVLLLPRLHGGSGGSDTAVSAARHPAATALMRHQLCRGQWQSCRGQLLQRLRGEISAASTTAAATVRASAVAGPLLQRLRGGISAASTTAAAVVRGSVACIAVVVVLSSCCVQS